MAKRILFITPVVLFCIFAFFTSCTDNPSKVQKEPPQLPPVESMSFDLSVFDQGMAQKKFRELKTDNYDKAMKTAGFMRLLLQMNLAFPRVLLMGAYDSDGSFIGDGKWEWSFSETRNGDTFGIRLVAIRENAEQVKWKFYVSSSLLELNDHLLFKGISFNDGTEGTWTYYSLFNTGSNTPVYEIAWSVKAEDNVELKMEMLTDYFFEKKGTFLKYMFDGIYKTVTYFDASTGQTTIIQWNAETNAGFIIAPDYNNGEKACWDENFQNVACTS